MRRSVPRTSSPTIGDDRDFVPVGPLNDHWAADGFAEMADWPITDSEADYAAASTRISRY